MRFVLFFAFLNIFISLNAQTFSFDQVDKEATQVKTTDLYNTAVGYGYDMTKLAPVATGQPFFFSHWAQRRKQVIRPYEPNHVG